MIKKGLIITTIIGGAVIVITLGILLAMWAAIAILTALAGS